MTIPLFITENANPPPTNYHIVLPAALRAQAIKELHELQGILAFVDSRLESIERFLNNFANQPNETNMNEFESDEESVDTPLVSPFLHSDNDSDDSEVLNELIEVSNEFGMLRQEQQVPDGIHMAFQCSFTYITDFVVLEDIGEFIQINKAEVRNLDSFITTTFANAERTIPLFKLGATYHERSPIFYKECLELGLEYVTGMDDEGEVTLYMMRRSLKVLRKFYWMILGG
ncbi:hypothetical protein Tco_1253312 [Tanacetum coccineum]